MLPIFAFLVTVAYWPGNPAAVVTVKWAVVSCAPLMLFMPRIRWSVIHTLACVLIGWAAVTALWAPDQAVAIDALWKMMLGFVLFMVGYEVESLDGFYIGAAVGLLPSSVLVAWQLTQGDPQPAGLFGNPNMLGEAAALVAIALFLRSLWWPSAIVIPALVLAQARGAYLAVLAVFAARGRVLLVAMVCMLGLLALPKHRALADLSTMQERLTIWRDSAKLVTVFGHGIGSFETVIAGKHSLPDKIVTRPHNEILGAAVELGVFGAIFAFALSGLVVARAQWRERAVLLGLGVEAMFGFPLAMPATAVIGAVVAGHAARGWAHIRARELVGGTLLRARPGEYGLP